MTDDARTELFPLSVTQEQLWLLDRMDPGNPFYNSTMMWRIDGPLDGAALAGSLERIIRRQQMLRAFVETVDGEPFQRIAPAEDVPVPLTVTDLTALPGLSAPERQAEADRLIDLAVHRPFDLARPPLFRVELVRTGPETHLMALVIHHVVSDGWSLQVMFQEVADLYAGLVTGTEVRLAPLTAQFTDYARSQRERLAGPRGRALTAYWSEQLAGAPQVSDLPTDRPRPATASFRGDRHVFQVPEPLYRSLKELGRGARASLFMVALAGFEALLGRISGRSDLLIGTPVGNRDRPEWGPLVGYFADTLVMRADLADDPSFQDLLIRVRRTTLNAFVHRDLPFRALVEELQPERAANRNPLFQVMFILQNIPPRPRQVQLPGVTLTRLDDVRATSIFDLRFDLFEFEDELRGQLEYSTDLFDARTVRLLAERWLALMADACADPQRRLSELSLGGTAVGVAAVTAAGFNDDLEEL